MARPTKENKMKQISIRLREDQLEKLRDDKGKAIREMIDLFESFSISNELNLISQLAVMVSLNQELKIKTKIHFKTAELSISEVWPKEIARSPDTTEWKFDNNNGLTKRK